MEPKPITNIVTAFNNCLMEELDQFDKENHFILAAESKGLISRFLPVNPDGSCNPFFTFELTKEDFYFVLTPGRLKELLDLAEKYSERNKNGVYNHLLNLRTYKSSLDSFLTGKEVHVVWMRHMTNKYPTVSFEEYLKQAQVI